MTRVRPPSFLPAFCVAEERQRKIGTFDPSKTSTDFLSNSQGSLRNPIAKHFHELTLSAINSLVGTKNLSKHATSDIKSSITPSARKSLLKIQCIDSPKMRPSLKHYSPFSQLHIDSVINFYPTISCKKQLQPLFPYVQLRFSPKIFPFFKVFPCASIRCASLARKPFLGIKRTRPHALCSAICPWPARRKSSTKTVLTFEC